MESHTVLLVAVERALAERLSQALAPEGVTAVACAYGPDTVRAIDVGQPSVLVADLSRLPADGEVLCRQVARLTPRPLLLAIVRDGAEPALAALSLGATACLQAPADPALLAAQVMALVRLAPSGQQPDDAVLEVGDLTIDRQRCEVLAGGRLLPLTPTEFRIISCLARKPGRVIPPSQVAAEAVDLSLSDHEAMELLKVHIYRLRRKIRAAGGSSDTLRNARGFGYLLERRSSTEAPAAPARLRRTA